MSKADGILKKAQESKKGGGDGSGGGGGWANETRRQRKKRLWLARMERMRSGRLPTLGEEGRRSDGSYWAFLPDLVLELIFQMLPYEVRNVKHLRPITCNQ